MQFRSTPNVHLTKCNSDLFLFKEHFCLPGATVLELTKVPCSQLLASLNTSLPLVDIVCHVLSLIYCIYH
uniref:Proteinaceous RNase P 1ic/mitochondrial-like n=1 Tax=Rhizophora mucronata TaxID=61149 RepID=A0A2P2KFX1_RHIMU